jgi:hypothetical protein
MKTVQTQKHLGQSVGFAVVFLGMTVAIVALMIVQSGGW